MDDIKTLQARLTRERAARLEAERIAEEALADLYETNLALDARVRDRTASLREALQAAEQAERAKDAFLKGVAHRTGSPLHAIQGFIDLVARDLGSGSMRDGAVAAAEEARRLSRAFEALLELSEALSGPLPFRPGPLEVMGWVDQMMARWMPEVANRGRVLSVRVDDAVGPQVLVDGDRLRQIIDPLLDNAVQHGAGMIGICISWEAERGLIVVITDQGDGVPADLTGDAFDAFVSARGPRGFGVGLTLARSVAESMGGRVEQRHEADQTTFEVILPTAADGPAEEVEPGDSVQPDLLRADAAQAVAEVAVDGQILRTLSEEIGSTDILSRLVDAFTGSVVTRIADLEGEDDAARRRAAHSLVSSSAQLGMHDVSTVARMVEHGDDAGDVRELIAQLRGCEAPLRAALRAVCG